MGGALSGACRMGACLVGRLLCARMFDSIARWSGAPWGGVKNLFLVHFGEYILTFEFYVIYISVKYLIPFYFGNYCDIKF